MPLGDVGGSTPLGQTLQIIHGGIPLLNGIAHLDQFQLTFTLAMLCGIKAKPGHVHCLQSSAALSVIAATQLPRASIWLVECNTTLYIIARQGVKVWKCSN